MSLHTQNPLFIAGTPWSQFDDVIDVRTPAEYALDHIPGAINLPVLSDEQRIEVGTLYKQTSQFEAKKLGASIIIKNIAEHLSVYFRNKPENHSVLVYCWRGGQRSQSLGLILQKIGFRAKVLQSGYKGYRRHVNKVLETLPQTFTYRVLCGLTGAGKTEKLVTLKQQGDQVLNLEELACHRGSLLGEIPGLRQPSQKLFDSRLAQAFSGFDAAKTVWIESESERIGRLHLPKTLWETIKQSRCEWVESSRASRAARILEEYNFLIHDVEFLKEKLSCLKAVVGKARLEIWFSFIESGQWQQLVDDLLLNHYDICYLKALKSNFRLPNIFSKN